MNKPSHLGTIKLVAGVITVFMLISIFELPYGYYTFLRWIVLVGAGIITYNFFKLSEWENPYIWGSIISMILWNPMVPIYMEKGSWVVFDIVGGMYFAYLAFKVTSV